MAEKRIKPSDPEYEVYRELWELNALAHNPDLISGDNDLESWDFEEIKDALHQDMGDLLDGLPAVFVRKLAQAKNGRSEI